LCSLYLRALAPRSTPFPYTTLFRSFKKLPRMTYGVKAIPADRARTAAPYYERPALDGTRAGNFYLKTIDPETQSKCCMESLIIQDRKSTRLNSSHVKISYAVFCLKK